jgi:hypothetical protein
MTDRRRRSGVDLSALSPDAAEVVRAFAAALQQACEEETEKMLFSLYGLELFCDGMAALRAEQMSPDARSGVKSRSESGTPLSCGRPMTATEREGAMPRSLTSTRERRDVRISSHAYK